VRTKVLLILSLLLIMLFSGCGILQQVKGLDLRGTWLGEGTPDNNGEGGPIGFYITTQQNGQFSGSFMFYFEETQPVASFEPALKGFGFEMTGTVDIEGNVEMNIREKILIGDPDEPEYWKWEFTGTVEGNQMSGTYYEAIVDEDDEVVDDEEYTGTWTVARE